ncbi:MAG TPA: hypothetical protein VHC49_22575 [Mycobacteriales bacterium]|nr:hypothetical protein [Mycobacteriales bacterium]
MRSFPAGSKPRLVNSRTAAAGGATAGGGFGLCGVVCLVGGEVVGGSDVDGVSDGVPDGEIEGEPVGELLPDADGEPLGESLLDGAADVLGAAVNAAVPLPAVVDWQPAMPSASAVASTPVTSRYELITPPSVTRYL